MIEVNGPRYGQEENHDAPRPIIEALPRMQEEPASSLSLLIPEPVEVSFVDWRVKHDEETGEDYREPFVRRARISTFVPMAIFNKMLAGRERVARLKQMSEETGDAAISNSGEYLAWVIEMTHSVWQLTEPGMSRERFMGGLQMPQILELFERFFGEQMRSFAARSQYRQATRGV